MLFTKQVSAVNITVKLNDINNGYHTVPDTNILMFGSQPLVKLPKDSDVRVPYTKGDREKVLWCIDDDALVRVTIGEHELVRSLEWVRAYALSGIAHPSWFEKELLEMLQFDVTRSFPDTLTIKPWFDIEETEEETIDA